MSHVFCLIRNYVTQEVMAQLVTSLVISRLDYCNLALAGLPASTLVPLQQVQNAAARLVLNLVRRSHITPAAALAASQVPHHLQDRDVDAPHSTRPISVVSRRHGKLLTTSTQVVTNQSCSRETDTDAIWQMRLLSLWFQYMEQSSSSSPQH